MEKTNLGSGLYNRELLPNIPTPPTPSTTTHQVQSQPGDAGVNHLRGVEPIVKMRVKQFESLRRCNEPILFAKVQHETASNNAHDYQCTCIECWLTHIEHRLFDELKTEMQKFGRCVERQTKVHQDLMTVQHKEIYDLMISNRYTPS